MSGAWDREERERLKPANAKVLAAFLDAGWLTLESVAKTIGLRHESTVASRLRDIKATGRYDYERRKTEVKGINEYRLFEKVGNPLQLELLASA